MRCASCSHVMCTRHAPESASASKSSPTLRACRTPASSCTGCSTRAVPCGAEASLCSRLCCAVTVPCKAICLRLCPMRAHSRAIGCSAQTHLCLIVCHDDAGDDLPRLMLRRVGWKLVCASHRAASAPDRQQQARLAHVGACPGCIIAVRLGQLPANCEPGESSDAGLLCGY